MHLLDMRSRLLATCLSAIAGYVDAIGFLSLGGFFASFMSGNSTRLAIGLASDRREAVMAACLIALFVAGVVIATTVNLLVTRRSRIAVLALVTTLLVAAAGLASAALAWPALGAMVVAMGAVNAVFQDSGEVRIGLTYMTGALVRIGQRLAAIPFGGDRLAWTRDLPLWAGLVAGAVAGARVYDRAGLSALWIPAIAAATLTLVELRRSRPA